MKVGYCWGSLFSTFPVRVGLIFRFIVLLTKDLCNQINLKYISLLLRQANGLSYAWNKFDFWCLSAR